MNDILNFKSITTYRLKLPMKFKFETAKGEVRNFSDLSTAYGVVCDAGWYQSILLEG